MSLGLLSISHVPSYYKRLRTDRLLLFPGLVTTQESELASGGLGAQAFYLVSWFSSVCPESSELDLFTNFELEAEKDD